MNEKTKTVKKRNSKDWNNFYINVCQMDSKINIFYLLFKINFV